MSNLFLAILCALTSLIMTVIITKATRLVWHSGEKVIPAMLVSLNLSLLGSTLFFSWNLYRVYSHPWPVNNSQTQLCEETIYPYLPVVFLTCAILLNVNKWIYCLMHINFYKFHQAGVSVLSSRQNRRYKDDTGLVKLSVKKAILNWATFGIITLYLAYNITYFIIGCTYNFEKDQDKWMKDVFKKLELFT